MKINDLIIDIFDLDEIILEIDKYITNRKLFTFSYINIHIINLTLRDRKLKESLLSMGKLFGDGVGIYLASKILYRKNSFKKRITGTDLYYKIIENAEINNWSISFYGGSDDSSLLLEKILLKKYPDLVIKTIMSRNTLFSIDEIVEILNCDNSDILMVGLGSPEQERWLYDNSLKINIPVQLCVGSGIDFLSNNLRRAPVWMRRIGFEWLYRLFQEPKRLWKRYIIGIPFFMFYILSQKIKLMFNKS